jgi:uncharacterized protein
MQRFTLDKVKLGESPFAQTQKLIWQYAIDFPEDRLLHTFRVNAGLPSDAVPLGGWERPESKIRGQFLGHFLKACANFGACEDGQMLRAKSERIVDALAECQEALGGEYLSAFPETEFTILEEQQDHGVWAPYYVIDKILQGLLSCHLACKNDKALEMAIKMASYFGRRIDRLSPGQISGILQCTKVNPKNEFGAMSDVLHRLYAVTGDEAHLQLAHVFDRGYFLEPLMENTDILSDLHSNTHLPMISGAARHYEVTGDTRYRGAVEHFWDILTRDHTYATGNSSGPAARPQGGTSDKSEHWGAPGVLSTTLLGGEGECCCGHNTKKVAADLLAWTGLSKYGDHVERLMYNSVLNSSSRKTGMSQYHQPLGIGAAKVFATPYDTFWCCTCSGVEAFSEIQNDIFYKTDRGIRLNLFVPSVLEWEEAGATLVLRGDFPNDDRVSITLGIAKPKHFAIELRTAYWLAGPLEIDINGKRTEAALDMKGIATLDRLWHNDDKIEVRLPMSIHTTPMPDDPDIVAVMYGPVVLAALSEGAMIVDDPTSRVRRTSATELAFEAETVQGLVKMIPLYEVEEQTYSVYLNRGGAGGTIAMSEQAQDGESAY